MTDQDALDIGAYLMSQEPVANQVPEHELPGYQFRWMMAGWNIMADFMEGAAPTVSDDPQVQRGAYLALLHLNDAATQVAHEGPCVGPQRGAQAIGDCGGATRRVALQRARL